MTTIPTGLCQCGCGKPTTIAKRERWGRKIGEYLPYLRNHSPQCHKSRRAYKKNAIQTGKRFVAYYLSTRECMDCGEKDPIVLQFHHRNPAKKIASIANLIGRLHVNTKIITREIKKCDVLCANCHLRRHARSKWRAMKTS